MEPENVPPTFSTITTYNNRYLNNDTNLIQTEATKARTECAMLALKDLIKFLEEDDGDV